MDSLVSVVIPVYNVCPYLREALDSVINQTYKNLEIIIIDDGSTDGSGDICDEYALLDSRIRVIHQTNKGLSTSRNIGIENSSGELIAFMDPDDAYILTFFEKMVFALFKENADMVICRCVFYNTTKKLNLCDNDKVLPSIRSGIHSRTEVLQALIDGKMNVGVWNKLYRREIWNLVRFYDGHVFEDHETAYRICCKIQQVFVISDVLYLHRKRPGSITSTHTKDFTDDAVLACARTEAFIRENMPSVFSNEQLLQFELRQIKWLLGNFIQSAKIICDDKRSYRQSLREQILLRGSKCNIKCMPFHVRTAYKMLRDCPWLLDLIFPCYNVFRDACFRLTGR